MLGRIAAFMFLAHLALIIAAVADCLGGENEPRKFPRRLWVAIIVLVPVIGGVAWFTSGRPLPGKPGGGTRPRPRPPVGPTAPDDDPEFLKDLERRLRDDSDDR